MIANDLNKNLIPVLKGAEKSIKKVLSDLHDGAFSSHEVGGYSSVEEFMKSFEAAVSREESPGDSKTDDPVAIPGSGAYEPLDKLCAALGLDE